MKKFLAILFTVLLLTSCTGVVNYRMRVKKGDIRKTFTEEYVLTEICDGTNGFGMPFWDKVSIEKRDTDDENKTE